MARLHRDIQLERNTLAEPVPDIEADMIQLIDFQCGCPDSAGAE